MKIPFASAISLIFFALAMAGHLNAQKLSGEKVVGSTSPNHDYTVFCTADGVRDHFEHFIIDVRSLRSKSNIRLVRTRDLDMTHSDDDFSSVMLYEFLGCQTHGIVHKVEEEIDPLFDYYVHWNSKSTLLCIEGGERRFWHCCMYRKTRNGFTEVRFDKAPGEKLVQFTKESTHKIHNMGVTRFEKYQHEGPSVHLLEDGYVAIDADTGQHSPDFACLPEEKQQRMNVGYDLYFLWHLGSTGKMKFVGFCR